MADTGVRDGNSCGCGHCHTVNEHAAEVSGESERSGTFDLIRLGMGALIFLAGIIFRKANFSFILYLFSYAILGYPVLISAVKNIVKGRIFNENLLMLVATIGAIIIGEYPEAAGVMLFYGIGEMLQERAVDSSKRSIRSLLSIKPDFANIEEKGILRQVSPEDVRPGDMITVSPGEKIPLDGIVVQGESIVDTSAITGESLPRETGIGDEVYSGTVNQQRLLKIRVTKPFGESSAAKILTLVGEAASKKAETETFLTRFAKYYTPAVVVIAALIAVLPPLIMTGGFSRDWFYRGLIFLVVSCPCALVLSIPLAYFAGIGAASRRGILVKGGKYLDVLSSVKQVFFDKTGTLTTGDFKITDIRPVPGVTEEDLLFYAAYCEHYSGHPIAAAIREGYGKEIDTDLISDHELLGGLGVRAVIGNEEIRIGSGKLFPGLSAQSNGKGGGKRIYVSRSGEILGSLTVSDTIKEGSYTVCRDLKKYGIEKTVMLTGDTRSNARRTAELIGIDEVYADLLPQDKIEIFESEKKEDSVRLAVGDGTNDAPLLSGAEVSIAMGALGSDAAVEAADIVLMTDEPGKIIEGIMIARKTKRIVWQNIIFALAVKGAVMALSAFGLAAMYQAVIADVGVALIAVLNSIRIIRVSA